MSDRLASYEYQNPKAWPTRVRPGHPVEKQHRGYLEPELAALRETERAHRANMAAAERSVETYRTELEHTQARIAAVEAVLRDRGA